MTAKNMADYLSEVTADYTTTELETEPDNIMTEDGGKEQSVHRFSDGQRSVVTMSDTSYFTVTLQWEFLSPSEEGDIKDMFHDVNKANGLARSFYWVHPIDGETYTVRFLTPLSSQYKANVYDRIAISQLTLDILGVKPV